jgi:peptidoglycan/LPS O-acetylase OafA/YrhL
VHRPDWLARFGAFEPNVLDALTFGLFGVYVHVRAEGYGPFLWTMIIELWGSYLVLVACLFELRGRWSYVVLSLLALVGLAVRVDPVLPIGACYPAGALIALAATDGAFGFLRTFRGRVVVAPLVLLACAAGAAIVQMGMFHEAITAALAMVAFVAVLGSPMVGRFLSLPLSQWLGRLSFPLYLVQILVITTLTSWLIVLAQQYGWLSPWTAIGIGAVSLVACLILAQLFMPVERLSLRLAAVVGGWLGERKKPVRS